MHLPADLIEKPLGLNSSCFVPSCTPDPSRNNATLWKVVNADMQNAGFGAPIKKMVEQLSHAGVRIMYNTRLVAIHTAVSDSTGRHRSKSMLLRLSGIRENMTITSQ